MKRFGVIGAGRFGSTLAESLASSGAEVILIERNREIVQHYAQSPITAVQGDAGELDTLRELGFATCETVIVGIGENMEGSIMATVNCKELGVRSVIAKASTVMHGKVLERVGADFVVYPNRDRALRLARSLLNRTPIDLFEIANGYSVAEVVPPKGLVGKTLIDVSARQKYGFTVLAIRRRGEDESAPRTSQIAIGTEVIQSTDILVVFGHEDDLEDLRH